MEDSNVDLHRDFYSPAASYSAGSISCLSNNREPLALIVDNDDDNLVLMQYSLETLGIRTVAVENGYDAIEAAQIHSFSIVLLDILMPGLDGFAVLQQLKQNPKYQQVPIVAVTAMAFSSQQKHMLEAGFVECLTKPYLLDELSSLIDKYLTQTSEGNNLKPAGVL